MGGRIGLNLLTKYPNHFAHSIFLSTNLGLLSKKERIARKHMEAELIKKLKSMPLTEFIQNWYKSDLFKNSPVPSYRYKQSKTHLIQAVKKFSLAKQQNFWNSLQEIKDFSTFIYGGEDRAYFNTVIKLKQHGANVHQINNCTHALHLENVSACTDLILRSIDDHRRKNSELAIDR